MDMQRGETGEPEIEPDLEWHDGYRLRGETSRPEIELNLNLHDGFRLRDAEDEEGRTHSFLKAEPNPNDPKTYVAELHMRNDNGPVELPKKVLIPKTMVKEEHPFRYWIADHKKGVLVAGRMVAISGVAAASLAIRYKLKKHTKS